MNLTKKILAGALCAALILSATTVGTLAYLTDTKTVTNTFTIGNVTIELDETQVDEYGNPIDGDEDGNPDRTKVGNKYKMIPGKEYLKDPMVTVDEESEDCWLFVKLEESDGFDTFMSYDVAEGWQALEGYPDVYFREIEKQLDDEGNPVEQSFSVLKGDTITINKDLTSDKLRDENGDPIEAPTLTITAYAIQHEGFDSAEAAWGEVSPQSSTEETPAE